MLDIYMAAIAPAANSEQPPSFFFFFCHSSDFILHDLAAGNTCIPI